MWCSRRAAYLVAEGICKTSLSHTCVGSCMSCIAAVLLLVMMRGMVHGMFALETLTLVQGSSSVQCWPRSLCPPILSDFDPLRL